MTGPPEARISTGGDLAEGDRGAIFEAILHAVADAIIVINQYGVIELFNPSAERMFAYRSEAVIGKNISLLMDAAHQGHHDAYLSAYIGTSETKVIGRGRQLKARRSNGDVFPIELSVGEVKHASHRQFVGIIRDISDRQQAEKDLRESRERLAHVTRINTMGEMASGLAHEINQPLTAIEIYAKACRHLLVNHAQEEQKLIRTLDKISRQALRAGEVIRRLIAFVKKRTGQTERIDLHQLILEAVELAHADTRLLDHGVRLELGDQSPSLVVDTVQIQQVLLNLIRNAIDAMEKCPGEPVIIRSRLLAREGVEVAVVDSGPGVDPANRSALFTPFFTTKVAGLGMGLPICQSIVNAHGGHLRYAPGESGGSVFAFTLPTCVSATMAATNDG